MQHRSHEHPASRALSRCRARSCDAMEGCHRRAGIQNRNSVAGQPASRFRQDPIDRAARILAALADRRRAPDLVAEEFWRGADQDAAGGNEGRDARRRFRRRAGRVSRHRGGDAAPRPGGCAEHRHRPPRRRAGASGVHSAGCRFRLALATRAHRQPVVSDGKAFQTADAGRLGYGFRGNRKRREVAARMTAPTANSPIVPLSWGELLDKISILQIKSERVRAADAQKNIRAELDQLTTIAAERLRGDNKLQAACDRLKAVNEKLWDIEDRIRDKERAQSFDADFIALARSVYHSNDERATIKREINLHTGSGLIEEKQYSTYG